MRVDISPDATVIRFKPVLPEKVLERAEREGRHYGTPRLSVFADVAYEGETWDDVIQRLLKASERMNINPDTNSRFFSCSHAGLLLDAGFTFLKDGDDDEIDEHYSVDVGTNPDLHVIERFLALFRPETRPK